MLKTNSKAVNEKIKKIVMNDYNVEYFSYDREPSTEYNAMCKDLLTALHTEKDLDCNWRAGRMSEQDLFIDWLQGLPSAFDLGDDIYLHSAVDFLGGILEQTKEEKAKYEDMDAEKKAACLFYREIRKHADKANN